MDQDERLALEFLSGELKAIETRLYDHIATTFRWLMATLFAANGGAIVALLNGGSHLPGSLHAAGWFAAGLILALIMGALSTYMGHRLIRPHATARAKVNQGLITGDTDDAEEALAELIKKQKMTWWMWSPTYSGLGSLVCFIVGVLSIAGSIAR